MAKNTSKPPARKGRAFWEGHVRDWRRGGLSQTKYCREHGLSKHGLSYWKRRLDGDDKEQPVQFVELPTGAAPSVGSRPLFEFRLDEDLRVSLSFKLAPGIIRDMFGGRG
jgi:hypothetical protein